MFKQLFLVSIFSLLCFSAQSRVPENLAGTDLFTDITLPAAGDEAAKTIPLSNLNLCFGAELFTSGVIQALYMNGDVIEVVKTQAPPAADGTPGKDVFTTSFYKEIIKKEPLLYAEANPLAILTRALFFQTPGTSSMANFKVSEPCCEKVKKTVNGKEIKVIDDETTIKQWAFTVAHTIRILSRAGKALTAQKSAQLPQMMQNIGRERFNFKKPNGFSFDMFINDCANYAESNGFGKWFVARIFMSTVYERYGNKQEMVFKFYNNLLNHLKTIFPDVAPLETISVPSPLPVPFKKNEDAREAAYQAFKLIAQSQGIFEPLTYQTATVKIGTSDNSVRFPDCCETMIRNIVLKMIQREDGSFDASKVTSWLTAFFTKYNELATQSSSAAHNEWAKLLIDNIPGALYKNTMTTNDSTIQYELRNSLNNLLVVINSIFDLKIDSLNAYNPETGKDAPEAKKMLQEMLAAINAALKTKLAVESDIIEIQGVQTIIDAPGKRINGEITSPTGLLKFYMDVQQHGDLEKQDDNKQFTATPEQLQTFPYLVGTLQDKQNGLTAHHCIGLLNKPINESLLRNLLLIEQHTSCTQRMIYTATAQNYEIDKYVYCSLLSILVKHNQAFDTAATAAAAAVQAQGYGNDAIREAGLELFEALVKQNQALDTAASAAAAAVQAQGYRNHEIGVAGLRLFGALHAKNHGREGARQLLVIPENERSYEVTQVLLHYEIPEVKNPPQESGQRQGPRIAITVGGN